MKPLLQIILPALICFSFYSSAQVREKENALNGKTFSIMLRVTGDERPGMPWTADEISFAGGKLISKVMGKEEGFPPFDCSFTVDSTASGIIIHFTASGKNNGVSDITWEGTVTGNKIEGTAVWNNAHGPQTQTFS